MKQENGIWIKYECFDHQEPAISMYRKIFDDFFFFGLHFRSFYDSSFPICCWHYEKHFQFDLLLCSSSFISSTIYYTPTQWKLLVMRRSSAIFFAPSLNIKSTFFHKNDLYLFLFLFFPSGLCSFCCYF